MDEIIKALELGVHLCTDLYMPKQRKVFEVAMQEVRKLQGYLPEDPTE